MARFAAPGPRGTWVWVTVGSLYFWSGVRGKDSRKATAGPSEFLPPTLAHTLHYPEDAA